MADLLTIDVGADVAAAYRNADPQKRAKVQALLRVWLLDQTAEFNAATAQLDVAMQAMSDEAQRNGLTESALDDLLRNG